MANVTIDDMKESTFGELISQYAPDELRSPSFTNLRVFIDNDNHFWFIGKEVASMMGYTTPWEIFEAVLHHVPDEYQTRILNESYRPRETRGRLNGNNEIILIHELGLDTLAMGSRLPQAYIFQGWVYKVISKIRHYKQHFSNMIEEKNRIIEEMRPKAEFYDRTMDSSNVVPMTVIAKDFGMSANELYTLLCKLGIIYRISDTWVLCKQYQGKGYTATKSTVTLKDQFGKIHNDVEIATYLTEKGRGFIYCILGANNKFPLIER